MSDLAHRAAAVSALAGAALLAVGTYLHPSGADPNDALAAFTEYAADPHWVATHLVQLAGIALMVTALLLLSASLGPPAWVRVGVGGAGASLAIAAALQAVDGVALKRVIDAWAAAPELEKAAAFRAAFAVRQIEIGLASMLSLVLGATVSVYAVLFAVAGLTPRWLGGLALAGGVSTVVAGVAIAETGFSDLAMSLDMPAGVLLLVWMALLAHRVWRR